MTVTTPNDLVTVIDMIRYGASRFNAHGLCFGHSYDNALDEATQLVLHALHLPIDLAPTYGQARLVTEEKQAILTLFERRIHARIPAAYLIGEAWFANLCFKCDHRALVPRSPIAELIENAFEPWLAGRHVARALDLCTGSGCIALAMAHYQPQWQVIGLDISPSALSLAAENKARLRISNVEFIQSDLFAAAPKQPFQLIVTNPPYVTHAQVDDLPEEYRHEPELGLRAGADGLDIVLRILRDAPDYLDPDGILICEVGEAEGALMRLLPELDFDWIAFQVGYMGVFAIEASQLRSHQARITTLIESR